MRLRITWLITLWLLPIIISAQVLVVEVDTSHWTNCISSQNTHITFSIPIDSDFMLIEDHPLYTLRPPEVEAITDLEHDQYWITIELIGILDDTAIAYLLDQGFVDIFQLDLNERDAWMGSRFNSEHNQQSEALVIQLEDESFAALTIYGSTADPEMIFQWAIEFASTIHYSDDENIVMESDILSENTVSVDENWSVNYHPDWEMIETFDEAELMFEIAENMTLSIMPNQFDEDFDPVDFLLNVVPDFYPDEPESFHLNCRHAVFTTRSYEDNGETWHTVLLFLKMENGLYTSLTIQSMDDDFDAMREIVQQVGQTLTFIGESD